MCNRRHLLAWLSYQFSLFIGIHSFSMRSQIKNFLENELDDDDLFDDESSFASRQTPMSHLESPAESLYEYQDFPNQRSSQSSNHTTGPLLTSRGNNFDNTDLCFLSVYEFTLLMVQSWKGLSHFTVAGMAEWLDHLSLSQTCHKMLGKKLPALCYSR